MRGPERRIGLLIAVAGALAAVAMAVPATPVPARAAGALALAFLLPGAALLLALMPAALLRGSERLAIALGGSLAVTVVGAFLLHVSPGGITAASWAMLLGGITVVGGLVGALRVARLPTTLPVPADDEPGLRVGPWISGAPGSSLRSRTIAPSAVATLAAAGVLVVLAVVLARSGVPLGPRTAFTELWIVPVDGAGAVRIGVGNHEGDARDYRLEVLVDGREQGEVRRISLPDGGDAQAVVPVPPGSGPGRSVEARLWTADQDPDAEPVRLVRISLEPEPGTPGQAPEGAS